MVSLIFHRYFYIAIHKSTSTYFNAYLSLVVYDSEEEEKGCSEECILAGHCQCSKCK